MDERKNALGKIGVGNRVKAALNYKKPAFWIAVAAVFVCIVLVVCALIDPEIVDHADNSLTPFDLSGRYHVREVLYDDPNDVYPYTTDNTLLYDFAVSYEFKVRATESGEYSHAGRVERISLEADRFDRFFRAEDSGWLTDENAISLREQNHFAWKLEYEGTDTFTVYYILQQNNQNIILLVGTRQKNDAADTTVFHCGFLLDVVYGDYRGTVVDQAYGDIDGDGKKETCYITYGPLSGLSSFRIIVKANGEVKYNSWFTGYAKFTEDYWGNLKLNLLYSEMNVVVDVKVTDGNLQLYKDGEKFEYYEWYSSVSGK